MKVIRLFSKEPLRNFTYILYSEKSDEVICIDPLDPDLVMKALEEKQLKLKTIINTHEHWDHIAGNDKLRERYQAKIMAHEKNQGGIPHLDYPLKKGDRIILDENHYLEVMDTPGHTFAHLCLLAMKDSTPFAVFTGDTVFNAGVGNCHNGGDPEVLYETISDQFFELPEDIILYPGHEYWENNLKFTLSLEPGNTEAQTRYDCLKLGNSSELATLGDEKKYNTFFRLGSYELKSKLFNGKADSVSDKKVFLKLRELRNNW